jgi:hypothetical protein
MREHNRPWILPSSRTSSGNCSAIDPADARTALLSWEAVLADTPMAITAMPTYANRAARTRFVAPSTAA